MFYTDWGWFTVFAFVQECVVVATFVYQSRDGKALMGLIGVLGVKTKFFVEFLFD